MIELATGKHLDAHAEMLGMRRKLESDAELRARLLQRWQAPRVGTVDAIDVALTLAMWDVLPRGVGTLEGKSLIAIHWLRASKPAPLFTRLVWYWRTWRAIWGKR